MLHIAPENPFGPVATNLIAALCRELADRYSDRVDDASGNFAPADATLPRSIFLTAWWGDEAVGCGALRLFDAQTAEVKRMYVDATLRGRGIGREILHELERYARDFGYARLCLETGDRQPEAMALYEKFGFVPIPRYAPYSNSVHSLCFAKVVTASGTAAPAA